MVWQGSAEGSQSLAGRPRGSLPLAALLIALTRPLRPLSLSLSLYLHTPVADLAYLLVSPKALSH
jgi:hypothetical protein